MVSTASLVAAAALLPMSLASSLTLSGNAESQINFLGAGAAVRASCLSDSPASFWSMNMTRHHFFGDHMSPIRVQLKSVQVGCGDAPLSTPCISTSSAYPPLFYCMFDVDGRLARTGPVAADYEEGVSRGANLLLELRPFIDCPQPDNVTWASLLNGAQPGETTVALTMQLRLKHWAPLQASSTFETDATSLPYVGLAGGDTISYTIPHVTPPPTMPPPSPPPPPLPPPDSFLQAPMMNVQGPGLGPVDFQCTAFTASMSCTNVQMRVRSSACASYSRRDNWDRAIYHNSPENRVCPLICKATTGSTSYSVCRGQAAQSGSSSSVFGGYGTGDLRGCSSSQANIYFTGSPDNSGDVVLAAGYGSGPYLELKCSGW